MVKVQCRIKTRKKRLKEMLIIQRKTKNENNSTYKLIHIDIIRIRVISCFF